MKRSLLLAAVAVLAVLALFLWRREVASPERALEPARPAAVVAGTGAIDLATPSSTPRGEARTEIAEAPTPPPAATAAAPAWTGVRVRVTAVEDGRALSGIRIRAQVPNERQYWKPVERSHGTLAEEVASDANGVAELELPAGATYSIYASSEYGSTSSDSVAVDPPLAAHEVREISIALRTRPDLVFYARVIDRETRAPIAGARIELDSRGTAKATPELTDADGRFRVEGATWTTSVHTVTAEGYPIVSVAVVPGHATLQDALLIELSRAATLRVRILEANGAPVANGRAFVSTAEYRLLFPYGSSSMSRAVRGNQLWDEHTGADGTASLEGLAPRVPLDASASRGTTTVWRSPAPIVLEPGEVRDVEWRIDDGAHLRGIVLELDGRPVPEFVVCLEATRYARPAYFARNAPKGRRVTKTDREGRFSFSGLGPGAWVVGPAPGRTSGASSVDDADPAAFAQYVAIAEGEVPPEVEIRVHRGLTIQGRVLDPAGRPADFAALHVRSIESGAYTLESSNDPTGQFVIGPLVAGEYEVRASSMGDHVDSLPMRARAGDRGLELHLRRGGGLHGVVVDRGTGAPCSATLTCAQEDAPEAGFRVQSTGKDGSFALDGLAPGTYALSASTTSGRVGALTGIAVAAGSTSAGLRLEVDAGAHLHVRFGGPTTVAGIQVRSRGAIVFGDGLEKGTEREIVVPAGELVVRMSLHEQGRDFDLPLTLKVGETRDLVFDGAWK